MPTKNTKAIPKDIPFMRIFPKARPIQQISANTTTVCNGD